MKLLVITQKVDINDDVLGFFHDWLAEFARQGQSVVAICLQKGKHDLPGNVKVLSLGKESLIRNSRYSHRIRPPASAFGASRWRAGRLALYLYNFYRYIWGERKNYDIVLVHMNPEYVLLGWPIWRLLGKKIALWYAHGQVDWKLRLAAKLVDVIFTSTKSGCRIKSRKIKIIGQGIDVNKFKVKSQKLKVREGVFKIITVGRISPVKGYQTLIGAVETLVNEGANLQVSIVGGAGLPKHEKYLADLKKMVKEKGLDPLMHFMGPVPNKDIVQYLQSADLFVNMSQTGSLDKAVLEAMACGLPILTCNEALREVLGEYQDVLMYRPKDAQQLAEKIRQIKSLKQAEREKLSRDLREIVVKGHGLANFVKKIFTELVGREELAVGPAYDRIVREKYAGDYEHKRWLADKLKKAGYQMTHQAIGCHLLGQKLVFKHCLELGPGAGTWTKFLAEKYPQAQFDLVDISEEMLKLVKAKLAEYDNIRYFNQDFLEFEPDKKYDLFFSCRAIEYGLPDKERVVKKIVALLRSGGRAFIITKMPKYWRAKLLGRKISRLHRGQISPRTLKKILKKYGFKNIAIYPVTMSFPLLKSAKLNKFLYRMFSKRPLCPIGQFFSESYLVKFSK